MTTARSCSEAQTFASPWRKEESAELSAGRLSFDFAANFALDFDQITAAYDCHGYAHNISVLADRVPGEARDASLTAEQRRALEKTLAAIDNARWFLGLVIDLPPHWKFLARRKVRRDYGAELDRRRPTVDPPEPGGVGPAARRHPA